MLESEKHQLITHIYNTNESSNAKKTAEGRVERNLKANREETEEMENV